MPPGNRFTAVVGHARAVAERLLEVDRAQLPLWSPVALGTGIACWFALSTRGAWMAFFCMALGSAAALLVREGSGRLARSAGFAFLLMGAGLLLPWGKAMLVSAPVLARPAVVTFDARVVRVDRLPARGIDRALLNPVGRPDLPRRVRVNIGGIAGGGGRPAGSVAPALVPGDRIRVRARLMPPPPPALPGGYDYARRAWFDGIGATGRVIGAIRMLDARSSRDGGLRRRLGDHVAGRMDDGTDGIAVALATGDQGRIAEADVEAMRRSGLAHLLSISGLHVTAVIGAVVFILFRVLALSSTLALRLPLMLVSAGAGAAAGIGYTLLTGAEVPTIRSCVSALLVMTGLALGREALSLRLLAVGALFVMLIWPEAVVGPSFQLSFAAVAAIIALYEHPRVRALVAARDEGAGAKALRFVGGLLLAGLTVEAVLAPIALFHFHQTGLLGAFANLIAIPLTEFVIMPAEAVALLLDALGAPLGLGAGLPAWWVADRGIAFLLWTARLIAGQSFALALTPAIPAAAFAVMMLGMVALMLWRGPLRWTAIPLLVMGMIGYGSARVPDVLVTADGRHVAMRTGRGDLAILRDRAGDYVRDQFSEQFASEVAMTPIADLPGARCSPDLCILRMGDGGSAQRIAILRSRLSLPWRDLVATCTAVDIVIAERRLPDACRPRWLKIDRTDLGIHGGAAIDLTAATVRRSRNPDDQHPWIAGPLSTSQRYPTGS